MRRFSTYLLTVHLMLLGMILDASIARAQEVTPKKKPVQPARANQGAVREVKPDVFITIDKDGDLRQFINYKYEDLMELINKAEQPLLQKPRFTVEELNISAKEVNISANAIGERVEMQIMLTVRTHEAGAVRVPLDFSRIVFSGQPKHTGGGTMLLDVDAGKKIYVAWIDGPKDTTHRIELSASLPVTSVGDEKRLRMRTPSATTSRLKLIVPMAAKADVVKGGQLQKVSLVGGKTEINIAGLGGDLVLSWRKASKVVAKVRTALESEGEITAQIDSRSAQITALLRVRSVGGPFDQFQVRLPKGNDWVNEDPIDDYTISQVDGNPRLLKVTLPQPTTGPIEVRVVAEQSRRADQIVDLSGFEVVGASRQGGHVLVKVPDDWKVAWTNRKEVRQIDPAELPTTLRGDDVDAAFEYFRGAFTLVAKVTQKSQFVRVEPKYTFFVGAQQTRLEAKFNYHVRGAKARELRIEVPGWIIDIDKIGPENVFDVNSIDVDGQGVVTIPLKDGITGPIELNLTAHQTSTALDDVIVLTLPRVNVDAPERAIVTIVPDDNVELTPLVPEGDGLTPQQGVTTAPLPARQQSPLIYRADTAEAKFTAVFKVHQQEVAVDVANRVTLKEDEGGKVEQRLAYQVSYVPVQRVLLDFPRALVTRIEAKELEVLFENKPLVPLPLPTPVGANVGENSVMQIVLPRPMIGTWNLVCRWSLSGIDAITSDGARLMFPLVMPASGTLRHNDLFVTAPDGAQVVDGGLPWELADQDSGDVVAKRTQRLVSDLATPEALVTIARTSRSTLGSTVVERAWVQTWLLGAGRQERVVYRFRSQADHLTLTLPKGCVRDDVRVTLRKMKSDSSEALENLDLRVTQDNRLRVALPPAASTPRRYVLELFYRFTHRDAAGRDGAGHLSAEVARFDSDIWVERMYWQVILPSDEHLIYESSDLTREFQWFWEPQRWGRESLMEQNQLEALCGAIPLPEVPLQTNRYLFSAVGSNGPLEIRTAKRTWIVLLASGVVLAWGLALVYTPVVRRPLVLIAVGVALMIFGLWAPDVALLVMQAAVLGGVLAMLAALISRQVRFRRESQRVVRGSSIVPGVDVTSTETIPPQDFSLRPAPPRDEQASTATAPIVMEIPTSDSQS